MGTNVRISLYIVLQVDLFLVSYSKKSFKAAGIKILKHMYIIHFIFI